MYAYITCYSSCITVRATTVDCTIFYINDRFLLNEPGQIHGDTGRKSRKLLPTKHWPLFLSNTWLMLRMLQMENLLLFNLSPEVALAYMMQLPFSFMSELFDSPGVHSLPESCCQIKTKARIKDIAFSLEPKVTSRQVNNKCL